MDKRQAVKKSPQCNIRYLRSTFFIRFPSIGKWAVSSIAQIKHYKNLHIFLMDFIFVVFLKYIKENIT